MSSKNVTEDVVSICYPSDIEIIWKDIPGFCKYQANNLGLVRHKRMNRDSRLYPIETSKGTYLRVSALDDAKTCRSKEVHYLVCLAFHGPPPDDGKVYEVNHKVGNKHHNLPGNLEWMTRRDNLIHAYKEGLRTDCRRVLIHDHLHDRVTEVHSINEVGRQMDISKSTAWCVIRDHKETKYRDRFTFSFIEGGQSTTRKAPHVKSVQAFDYVTGKYIVADNLGTLEGLTGVKRGTIAWQLKSDNPRLINGIWFKYLDDKTDFPDFNAEEIEISKYRTTGGGNPVKVTDSESNTTKLYSSINRFAVSIGVHPSSVRRSLKRGDGRSFEKYLIDTL